MILNNLSVYHPQEKKYGEQAVYLVSDDGKDWYDNQGEFSSDTLKVMYDSTGYIVSCSRDISTLYPDGLSVAEFDVDIDDARGLYVIGGKLITEPKPTEYHTWKGGKWTVTAQNKEKIKSENISKVKDNINALRDLKVNGGVYVDSIDKWIDSDATSERNLLSAKTTFDLSGDIKIDWICADNSAIALDRDNLTLILQSLMQSKMANHANAVTHKQALEEVENPLEYDYSTGWTTTYQEHLDSGKN